MSENNQPLLDADDRRLVIASQAGLPLVSRPYTELAQRLGWSEQEVMDRFRRLLACGAIRRIGAVPNHYAIGYTANGMSVWDIDDEKVDVLGERVGRLPFVTHCYQRPRRLPLWPYNLFAMVHGHSREEVAVQVEHVAEVLGDACRSHDILFSTRILKKTGLRLAG